MGVMTGTGGGVLRDVVANRDPLLLKEDIYATAALVGAGLYAALHFSGVPEAGPLPPVCLWLSSCAGLR